MMTFNEVKVAELAVEILKALESNQADASIKIAALQTAAGAIQNSVLVQGFATSLAHLLAPKK